MRIGIDLGGTKIEGIVLDAAGEVRWRRRVATPRDDYAGTLAAVALLVQALERDCGARCSVGVGIPGTLSAATGRVKNANATWLNDRALDADLVQALGRPVRLANDANCLAVSEASDGAGAGAAVVFGVILGTGVGGGIVVHGRPLAGANGIAGEWGHNPLPWPGPDEQPGPPCYCGKHGCIETFLSGPGFQRDFQAATGQALAPPEIAARAVAGEPAAAAALCRYEHRLARALASVINVLDPDVIVLAGGMSNIERLYASVPALWRAFVFSDAVITRLARNRHGDSSGVRGAAWLWPAGAPSGAQLSF
ncbi:MAG: ROK family protein [Defluviicoccus sp.]|nr:ROK family protein [Defluviicoccus sp.]